MSEMTGSLALVTIGGWMGTKIWATGWPDLINQEAITDQECDTVFETRRQAYSRNPHYSGVAVRDG